MSLKPNATNPGRISNEQHNDSSGAQKGLQGTGGVIESILATSTTAKALAPRQAVRVCNTDTATQFVYIGPTAGTTVSITTGIAIPAGGVDIFYSEDAASWVRTSSALVQVVLLKP